MKTDSRWSFLDLIPTPAFIVDKDYKIVYANREAKKFYKEDAKACYELLNKNDKCQSTDNVCPKTYAEYLKIDEFGTFHSVNTKEGEKIVYVLTSKIDEDLFLEMHIDVSKGGSPLIHMNPEIVFSEGPAVFIMIENRKGLPVRYVTPNVKQILGYDQEDLLSERVLFEYIINYEDLEKFRGSIKKKSVDIRVKAKDNSTKWIRVFMIPITKEGEITHYYGYFIDVSDKYEKETLFQILAENNPNGVLLYDFRRGRILYANRAIFEMTGYTLEELKELKNPIALIHPEDRKMAKAQILKRLEGYKDTIVYYPRIIKKDGSIVYTKIISSVISYKGRDVSLITIIDISQEKEREEKLIDMSIKDQLTGVYNRRFLDEYLAKSVEEAKKTGKRLGIILFDIDNFKKLNDTYGHQFGDEVLKRVASTVKEMLRGTDIIGRWGGEEFLVILPDTDNPLLAAERIRKKIEELEFPNGVKVTVSLGVAVYQEGDTPYTLLKRADEALYTAKRKGKNMTVIS